MVMYVEDFSSVKSLCSLLQAVTTRNLKLLFWAPTISMSLKGIYISKRLTNSKTYVSAESGNDIMLLELSRKVQLDNKIQKIRLPEHGINVKENQQCQVAGWGKTATDGKFVDELRMVDVSVIKLEVCKYKWPGLPVDVICAGGYGTNKGFCQGDFGGPLVCNGTAFGVVSFNNMKCDYPDVPNVYTDITKHLDWIDRTIKQTKH
uniref:Peptidase S1 domain-containing protein n=1 Tax=Anabas testudineus TaxID=64144 RepID=A0AAQ6IHM1_ANATE